MVEVIEGKIAVQESDFIRVSNGRQGFLGFEYPAQDESFDYEGAIILPPGWEQGFNGGVVDGVAWQAVAHIGTGEDAEID